MKKNDFIIEQGNGLNIDMSSVETHISTIKPHKKEKKDKIIIPKSKNK